ncbi:iron ABC transporter permease [Marinobacterium nitratireducens]|uniref:Iron ABC transporter permease n=1 Tax=Marinobacterium nitratireducens TaxID=518897 RepID=A0A917ZJ24_9GAMM|nr:iron ABC transporter permease [Marinobacterium nitratireducens]GGO82727.1 iron ABC transporter permease [Marinobacterium nitratireducens]
MRSDTAILTCNQPRLPRPHLTGWYTLAWGIALVVALPVLSVFYLALFPDENIWSHLASTVLPVYVITTIQLVVGVGLLSILAGVGSAWLVTLCHFPGRRLFEWALLLPFAVPAYVIAYVYTDLLEFAGPVQGALRALFGWETARDYWFPEIRSLGGAIAMLSLVLYPYVYLLARAAFLEQSVSLRDASRVLGCNAWQSFWRISLPIARPAIAVGVSLVSMETINDFGTVDYFAVKSLTAGIYDTWLNMYNLGGAAQIASLMLVFVVLLITLERKAREKQKQFHSADRFTALEPYRLHGWRAAAATLFCLLPVVCGFVLPCGLLAWYASGYLDQLWSEDFIGYASHSFTLSLTAAVVSIVIAVVLAYARRLFSERRSLQFAVRFSSLGYAMPGAVLALGVIIPLAAFDNSVDAFMRSHFNLSTGLLLSGTTFAVVMAYVVRFLAVSTGAVDSSLSKVTPSMDMASRSLGQSASGTLFRVHLPLIRGGLLTALLVVFVDCMKELPATLILRPFNYDTLATFVYQYASDEMLERCSLAALLIVLVGVLPVILLSRSITNTRQQA